MTLKEMVRHPKFTLDEFEAWLGKLPGQSSDINQFFVFKQFFREVVGQAVNVNEFQISRHGDQGESQPLPLWAAALNHFLFTWDFENAPCNPREIAKIVELVSGEQALMIIETHLSMLRSDVAAVEAVLEQHNADDAEDWVGHAR